MRPEKLETMTYKVKTGCGNAYITISKEGQGYWEVFGNLGKSGGCPSAMMQSLCRLATLAVNRGVPKQDLAKQLVGIRCPQDSNFIPSCPEALGRLLMETTDGERE
ncbi:MAG: TSCPD domain-containing protein [candidate division WOR-3 bacterium]